MQRILRNRLRAAPSDQVATGSAEVHARKPKRVTGARRPRRREAGIPHRRCDRPTCGRSSPGSATLGQGAAIHSSALTRIKLAIGRSRYSPRTGIVQPMRTRGRTKQTLAWASSYYLPAMLASPMAASLHVSVPTVFMVSAVLGPLAASSLGVAAHLRHPASCGQQPEDRQRNAPVGLLRPSPATGIGRGFSTCQPASPRRSRPGSSGLLH